MKLWALPVLLGLAAALVGCGRSSLPRDELDRARDRLEASLSAWKKGDSASKRKAQEIDFNDPDRAAGMRLDDYLIYDTEGRELENIRCGALLTLRDRQSKKHTKEVYYTINCKEKISISREPGN